MAELRTAERTLRYAELYRLFDAAARGVWSDLDFGILVLEHARSSQLFADLSVEAAREAAREMKPAGAHPDVVWPRLQLAGFLNPSGNRLWNRELTERVGSWRT